MIDRDEMRIARRTVERNGYTVLPPIDKDERDLNRFRDNRNDDFRNRHPVNHFDDEPRFKPLRSRSFDDHRPMSDLEKAKRTAELNGYSVQKMSRLDQAKQVAKDAGYDVRKVVNTNDDRPMRRIATHDGTPMRHPVINREPSRNSDGIRLRTAPDSEIKSTAAVDNINTKKKAIEDDYMNRAAAFFGDEE